MAGGQFVVGRSSVAHLITSARQANRLHRTGHSSIAAAAAAVKARNS